MTYGWAGLRSVVAALAMVALSSAGAGANSIQSFINYSTSGTIDSSGVAGAPIISFNSVSNNSFLAPSSLSLGEFMVGALPDGVTSSYSDTPFKIALTVNQVNGSAPKPNQTPIVLTGELNGTVTGSGQSSVVATFDPISAGTFQTGGYLDKLGVLDPSKLLVPSTTNGGRSTVQAQITVQAAPVPEPASVAVFIAALGGLGLWQRKRARLAA